ncbi:short-chain dehydrogenase/reductase family 16C member 6-like [Daktulosphaira vitifoliae]|uniref:short-chain dehydrogenase/reductase family 16C member 6-like n=1 Tax=Daktulosphaira vitifoliae TaxID=58002 RepID=UPI0021AADC79|nr:short-chain dehydrogenase/reductase family 16C member 6-like [Daktulosphaira vitifoliae]
MSKYLRTSQPISLIFELLLFSILIVPSIIFAGIKNLLPAKRKDVKGQVILITGAARGLGRQLALDFHKLGAKIVCVDVNKLGNDETAQIINEDGGIAKSYTVDVSNKEQIKQLHEHVKKDLGPVDILINNAGIVWGHSYINPEKDEFIENIMKVNLLSHFWMNREILPSMLTRNKGHIVAISSMSSMTGVAGISSYTASKWAVNGSMECMDNELRLINSSIVTTTVLPYFVQTNKEVTKCLNLRQPELPTTVACKLIVRGILENRRIFSVPGKQYMAMSIIRLLPDNLQRMFSNIFYVKIIPDTKDKEIMDKYYRTS